MARLVFMQHPERRSNEMFLGNIELDNKEKEDFNWVKKKTGLKTIRVGKISYKEDGITVMHEFKGICDTFGPFPVFIEETEFEGIRQRNADLTPQTLFERIVERKTEKEAAKDKNKDFIGIVHYIGRKNPPDYIIQPPAKPGNPKGVMTDSLDILANLIIERYGAVFEHKTTFTPPKRTSSEEFQRLSDTEEKLLKTLILENLTKKHN